MLRFPEFNTRTTPEIKGTVSQISADTTTDQRTGQSYYTVRIAMPAKEIEQLGKGAKLIPGMPVEAFVQTGERTVISYLTKPLTRPIHAGVPGKMTAPPQPGAAGALP